MQHKNPTPRRDTELAIPLEMRVSFLTLAAVAVLGAAGVLLVEPEMTAP